MDFYLLTHSDTAADTIRVATIWKCPTGTTSLKGDELTTKCHRPDLELPPTTWIYLLCSICHSLSARGNVPGYTNPMAYPKNVGVKTLEIYVPSRPEPRTNVRSIPKTTFILGIWGSTRICVTPTCISYITEAAQEVDLNATLEECEDF